MNLGREQIYIILGGVVLVVLIANTVFKGSKVSHFVNHLLGYTVPILVVIGGIFYFTRGSIPFVTAEASAGGNSDLCEKEVFAALRGTDGLEAVHVNNSFTSVEFSRGIQQDAQKAVGLKAAGIIGEFNLKAGKRGDLTVVVKAAGTRVYRVLYNPANGVVEEEHY